MARLEGLEGGGWAGLRGRLRPACRGWAGDGHLGGLGRPRQTQAMGIWPLGAGLPLRGCLGPAAFYGQGRRISES